MANASKVVGLENIYFLDLVISAIKVVRLVRIKLIIVHLVSLNTF